MRRISLIAWIALPAAATAALAGIPSPVEAGEFGLRLGTGSAAAATSMPVMSRASQRIAAAVPFSPAVAATAGGPTSERPDPVVATRPVRVAPAPERAKPVPAARIASAWCPTDRIAGAGTGFCEIN